MGVRRNCVMRGRRRWQEPREQIKGGVEGGGGGGRWGLRQSAGLGTREER